MKKSIITSGMAASNRLYSDALTETTNKSAVEGVKDVIQVYKWQIETELGTFTGTCLSMDGVNEEIALLTNQCKILKKNIIPVSLIKEPIDNKIYSWNVITSSGHASGVSASLEEAKRVLNSFDSTEVLSSSIVESVPTE